MNKELNHIVNAFLFLLLIPAGSFIINKANSIPRASDPITTIEIQENSAVSRGKMVFMAKCASCHHINKNMTGPALAGLEKRGPWNNRNQLYEWVRNPGAFMQKDPYTRSLKDKYKTMMTAFFNMPDAEIDAIVDYINQRQLPLP